MSSDANSGQSDPDPRSTCSAGPTGPPVPDANAERFSMHYGTLDLVTGWFVTFLLFCLGLTVVNLLRSDGLAWGWYLLPAALMFGFPVAAIVGLPLAVLIAWLLRRIPDQRLHVLLFAVGVGAATAVTVLLGPSEITPEKLATIAGAAASAAIGRAVVIGMVARRNPQYGARPGTRMRLQGPACAWRGVSSRWIPGGSRCARDQSLRRSHP